MSHINHEAGRLRLFSVRDLSERVAEAEHRAYLEAQLRQALKMEAIGRLADTPAQRGQLSTKGLQAAQRNSRDELASRMVEVLESIAN